MDRKIRIGAVSYLNTKPLLYGFEKGLLSRETTLSTNYPSALANQLLKDDIDVGLIPVAALPALKERHIISEYCIGASKPVGSVCIFSEVPLAEVKELYLDYQSRTSVALAKILLKQYWKTSPKLLAAHEGYEQQFGGTTAALIIGDRALYRLSAVNYVYDLAEAWQQMTGLPFVFAVWAANKQLHPAFIHAFNETTGLGLKHIPEIVAANPFDAYNLHTYFTQNIDYRMDEAKMQGLKLFLEMI